MNGLKFRGDLLLGYNSDSVSFEINNVFLLIVLLSFVTRGNASWTVYRRGGYSLRCVFLTEDSQPLTVEINHFALDGSIEVDHFATRI